MRGNVTDGVGLPPGLDELKEVIDIYVPVAVKINDRHLPRLHLHPAVNGLASPIRIVEPHGALGRHVIHEGDLRLLGHGLVGRPAPGLELIADGIHTDDQLRLVDIEWKRRPTQDVPIPVAEPEPVGRSDLDSIATGRPTTPSAKKSRHPLAVAVV